MDKHSEDYLWDPSAAPDPHVRAFERLLKPLGAHALDLAERELLLPQEQERRFWKFPAIAVAAATAAFAILATLHSYRLSWPEGSPWPITVRDGGMNQATVLSVGERLATASDQTATLSAARIGEVVIAPNSVVQLVSTRGGRHRIELQQGRLHAKIWAPPNYFGVVHGHMRFVDLGCEFDLSVDTAGNGVLSVASGWVIYGHRDEEILVPEHYVLAFDSGSAQIPLRRDASNAFRGSLSELERVLISPSIDESLLAESAQRVARYARDEDYFTMLMLLVRHPHLARGPLYPRLAAALKIDAIDDLHRARWMRGDADAREEWWQRLPKQPKSWWLNWRDAL